MLQTWAQGQQECLDAGMEAATMEDLAEEHFAFHLWSTNSVVTKGSYHLGGKRVNNVWTYPNGTTFYQPMRWASADIADCLATRTTTALSTSGYHAIPCNSQRWVMCQAKKNIVKINNNQHCRHPKSDAYDALKKAIDLSTDLDLAGYEIHYGYSLVQKAE